MRSRAPESLNFSWLLDDEIAGCAAPMVPEDLDYLKSQGIRATLRLADPKTDDYVLDSRTVEEFDLIDRQIPVKDFHAPDAEQIDEALEFIEAQLKGRKPVVVSCGAGCGRTGTILACYLVSLGKTADEALEILLSARPCSVEILARVPAQEAAIRAFERRLKLRQRVSSNS